MIARARSMDDPREPQSRVEDDTTLDAFLEQYGFIECRESGHSWTAQQRNGRWNVEGVGPHRVYTKTYECAGCGTTRTARYNYRFERLHPRYDYPSGYQAEPGMGFSRTDVCRFEILRELAAEEPPTRRVSAPVAALKKPTRRRRT